ncbi:MAG TPA: hypothetical protein VGL55_17390 [Steroidobacteraceae bacterium]|jgi:hypothetical protein
MPKQSKTHAGRVAAYAALCAELGGALREEDPSRTHGGTDSPADRYDSEAARLAVDLRTVATRAEVRFVIRRTFGSCSPTLLDRIERALERFRLATEIHT